jgi:hypothetical protein
MLNEFKLPLPVVQAITQCRDPKTILSRYRQYNSNEAAHLMDKLYPPLVNNTPDEAE